MPLTSAGKYFVHAIDSVLKQDFTEFELVVLSNNLPENIQKILDDYAHKNRLRIIPVESDLIIDALDIGIKAAQGQYIAFQGPNDYSAQGRLKKQVTFMEKNRGVIGVSGCERVIAQDMTILGHRHPFLLHEDITRGVYIGDIPSLFSSMFKKSALEKIRFDVTSNNIDVISVWQQLLHTGKIYSLPEIIYTTRQNDNRRSIRPILPDNKATAPLDSLWSITPPMGEIKGLRQRYYYYSSIPIIGDTLSKKLVNTSAQLTARAVRLRNYSFALQETASLILLGPVGISALVHRLGIVLRGLLIR